MIRSRSSHSTGAMPTARPIRLLVVTASLGGCAADASDDAPRYLLGLSADEIIEIVDHYDPGADPEALLVQLEAPFRCDRFPGACESFGVEGAQEVTESLWAAAYDGAPPDALLAIATTPAATTGSSAPIPWPIRTATASVEDTIRVWDFPYYDWSLSVMVVDLGITVTAATKYTSKTRQCVDLYCASYVVADNPADADLDLTLSTGTGVILASNAASFADSVEGTVVTAAVTATQSLQASAAVIADDFIQIPWGHTDEQAELEVEVGL